MVSAPTTLVGGLRERARVEHLAAEARRAARQQATHDGAHARLVQHTEELLRTVLQLEIAAPRGEVEIEGLTIGARFVTVAGHTSWRLCLIERCVLCDQPYITPLVHGYDTLGHLLDERERRNIRPFHPTPAGCERARGMDL